MRKNSSLSIAADMGAVGGNDHLRHFGFDEVVQLEAGFPFTVALR